MDILVLNCGSSSIKFQLIDMKSNTLIAKGKCDAIGYECAHFSYSNVRDGYKNEVDIAIPTHKEAIQTIFDSLMDTEHGVITSLDEIDGVGHRIVHGGEHFNVPVLVTDKVADEIQELNALAPLHNASAVIGIRAVKAISPELKNVVVFDTAYHQTIPEYNYMYAINYDYYKKYSIRKYGFHGTSYAYVIKRLAEILNKPVENVNAIVCHLGGGASVCAIKNGKSFDTSMGFTPLDGLVMETRSGELDPAVVTKIMKEENLTCDEMDTILNKKSGRLGLCGVGDQREMQKAAEDGNDLAKLAIDIQTNRVKKYIGSYLAELNHTDAVVFTGGIGENNALEREGILKDVDGIGLELDLKLNTDKTGTEAKISTANSRIPIYIIPTNEELEIARQTVDVISKC